VSEEHHVLFDKSTGRPVLMAPRRYQRPRDTEPDQVAEPACPFCAGREDMTPPEVDRTGDAAGWTTRAFPNKYPACKWHEVFAEGSTHTSHPAELPADILRDALVLWRRRMTVMESQEDVQCAFLFKNVGRDAGSSIDHNHTQLIGLPMLPPRLQLELEQYQKDPDLYRREIDAAHAQGRVIFAGEHHVVLSPAAPKLPFENWLLPLSPTDDFLQEDHSQDLVTCMLAHFGAIDAALGTPPFNSYLHRVPGEAFHWHIELQPRTGIVAGLELGGDMSINSVTGEKCARLLREALAARG
jgi:UDPglucose--hexose-1-phosphate uridylyltransferase